MNVYRDFDRIVAGISWVYFIVACIISIVLMALNDWDKYTAMGTPTQYEYVMSSIGIHFAFGPFFYVAQRRWEFKTWGLWHKIFLSLLFILHGIYGIWGACVASDVPGAGSSRAFPALLSALHLLSFLCFLVIALLLLGTYMMPHIKRFYIKKTTPTAYNPSDPLNVSWLPLDRLPNGCTGALGISSAPGVQRYPHQRNMKDDMAQLKNDTGKEGPLNGIASLMLSREMIDLGMDSLPLVAKEQRIQWIQIPIHDWWFPLDMDNFSYSVKFLSGYVFGENKSLVVHCLNGKGRSGLLVAAMLLYSKIASSVEDAISIVRGFRENAFDNPLQILYLYRYEQHNKNTFRQYKKE